jgi:hypothetical protein
MDRRGFTHQDLVPAFRGVHDIRPYRRGHRAMNLPHRRDRYRQHESASGRRRFAFRVVHPQTRYRRDFPLCRIKDHLCPLRSAWSFVARDALRAMGPPAAFECRRVHPAVTLIGVFPDGRELNDELGSLRRQRRRQDRVGPGIVVGYLVQAGRRGRTGAGRGRGCGVTQRWFGGCFVRLRGYVLGGWGYLGCCRLYYGG